MKNSTEKRVLVTGSGGPLGVNITRSLKKAPEKIYLLGTEANSYHTHLSITDKTELIPPAKKVDEYLSSITQLVNKNKVDVIFPTHPVEVRTLTKHKNDFPGVRFLLPESEEVMKADDKWQTYRLLYDAGLPVPRTIFIQTPQDLDHAFDDLQTRPIWVRGAGTPGSTGIGVASLPCKKVEHAKAWVDYWNGWGGFIASEYLPGKNWTWTALFHKGELVASQSRERLEYVLPHVSPSGITGAPAVSRTLHNEKIHEFGEQAIRALSKNPNGAFFVDFKEDQDETPKITEINAGRFGTTIHFYTEAGANFPFWLVQLALGEKVIGAPFKNPVPDHTYWIRTLDCGPVLVRNLS